MFNWIRYTLLVCSLIIVNVSHASPSMSDYGALPETQMLTISPKGELIAFRRVTNDADHVIVISLATHKQVGAIDVQKLQPKYIYFLNENQLILIASEVTKVQGFIGKIDLSTAFLYDLGKGSIRQLLIPGDEPIYTGQSGLGILSGISADGNFAYMPAYVGDSRGTDAPDYSLLKVNLKSARSPTVFTKGNHDTSQYFMDNANNVIAQESYSENSNIHKIRVKKNDAWVDVFKDTVAIREKAFVGSTPDFKSLVVLDTNTTTGRTAYYTMSLTDGAFSEPIFSRTDADVEDVISSMDHTVFGVRYSGLSPSYQFFDPALDKKMKNILSQFPDQSVHLSSFSPDWKSIVVFVEGTSIAGDYYLFTDGKELQHLAASRPKISDDDIQPIGTVNFKARDGLKVPTVLTIPKSKVNDIKNLPAVIYPHGGPASHDTIGFDFFAQALASQGYLVIQPQFRGSDGFGLDHEFAGHGEWGKKMQDDITDAVNFAIKKGMIDPSRICIVGASYGGYAALAGGAFTPNLYKCVVSIAGISDLKTMLAWDKHEHGKDSWVVTYMQEQFTNGESDSAAMAAVSPLNYADKFTAPVLLIHGAEDKRVPIDESEQMNKALKKAKKEVTFVELKGEDHFLQKGPTRQQALEETVKFVNAHIGK
jgi:dipeptidyl aminopeptidase/acylaminoacyl peptidase